jgi:hypothetical protein
MPFSSARTGPLIECISQMAMIVAMTMAMTSAGERGLIGHADQVFGLIDSTRCLVRDLDSGRFQRLFRVAHDRRHLAARDGVGVCVASLAIRSELAIDDRWHPVEDPTDSSWRAAVWRIDEQRVGPAPRGPDGRDHLTVRTVGLHYAETHFRALTSARASGQAGEGKRGFELRGLATPRPRCAAPSSRCVR